MGRGAGWITAGTDPRADRSGLRYIANRSAGKQGDMPSAAAARAAGADVTLMSGTGRTSTPPKG